MSVQTRSKLPELSNDIWLLISEALHQDGIQSLLSLSRVSRRLHELLRPLMLKTILVNETSNADLERYIALLKHTSAQLAAYTHNLEVSAVIHRSSSDALLDALICELLVTCPKLETFRWRGDECIPHLTQQRLKNDYPNIQLHYEIEDASRMIDVSLLSQTPVDRLRTLKVVMHKFDVTDHTQSEFDRLADSISKLQNLEVLNIEMLGSHMEFVDAFYFERPQAEFPAIRDLTLTSYYWPDNYEATHMYWNFSRIERLVLLDTPLDSFLNNSTFATSDLSHLNELVLGIRKGGQLVSMLGSSPGYIQMQNQIREVWGRASNLRSLSILQHWRVYCPLDCFARFGHNLRQLKLLLPERKSEGRLWSEPRNNNVALENLDIIRVACPNLRLFHFAMTLSGNSRPTHLEVATALSPLTLLVDLRIEDEDFLGHDMAHGRWVNIPTKIEGLDVAKSFTRTLINSKQGLKYKRLVLVTSGRYSKHDSYNTLYFRKYQCKGQNIGFAEYSDDECERDVTFTDSLDELSGETLDGN